MACTVRQAYGGILKQTLGLATPMAVEQTIHVEALESLRRLLEIFREANARKDERVKATHERFNIFTTLLSEDDEVRLHTRFIHCLLDPEGSHDCGPRFLNLFLRTLEELGVVDENDKRVPLELPPAETSWRARREILVTDLGKIDILLTRQDFGFAIENKIYAREQEDQIARYADYLTARFGPNSRVIYLTPGGAKSETHQGRRYARISYASHILSWLDKCLQESYDIIPVNQVLLQYRALVRGLTGKDIDSLIMENITQFIGQNPDIIRLRYPLLVAIDRARAHFLDQVGDGIANELEQRHGFQVELLKGIKLGGAQGGDLVLTPPEQSVLHNAPFGIYLEYDPEWDVLAFGVSGEFHEPVKDPVFARMRELLKLKADSCYIDKQYPKWPLGWHNLLENLWHDETLADLLSVPVDHTVSAVCAKALTYFNLLESIYQRAKEEVGA